MGKKFIIILGITISLLFINCSLVKAEENTTVVISVDNNQPNIGETFKLYVKAQNVYDLYGVQFTISYDTKLLDLVSDSLDFKNGFQCFGGQAINREKGIVSYPLINPDSKKQLLKEQVIGELVFKAKGKGPVILHAKDIKGVNSKNSLITYNKNYDTTLNITANGIISVTPVQPAQGEEKPNNTDGNAATGNGNNSNTKTNNNQGNQIASNNSINTQKYNSETKVENQNVQAVSDNKNNETQQETIVANASQGEAKLNKPTLKNGDNITASQSDYNSLIVIGALIILIGIGYWKGIPNKIIQKIKGKIS